MKPGDLVRIKLKEFATKAHPLYGITGIIIRSYDPEIKLKIPVIPDDYQLWNVMIGGEIICVQGIDLDVLDETG
jgi:hypothetical protein